MKKCPLLKQTRYYTECHQNDRMRSSQHNSEKAKEEFQDCIDKECMAWDDELGGCLYFGLRIVESENNQTRGL